MRQVRQFGVYNSLRGGAVNALSRAENLDSVRHLTIQDVSARWPLLDHLTEAAWFRRLRHLSARLTDEVAAGPLVAGLGRLPELHTLVLPYLAPAALPQLSAGDFPLLGRLALSCPLHWQTAGALLNARLPRLAVFAANGCRMKNDGLLAFVKADWFSRLRVLSLTDNDLGDRGVAAVAAHPVARSLRALRLGNNSFGRTGLDSLSRGGVFEQLGSLDLGSSLKCKAKEADLAAFLSALALPHLRHLDLSGWPVGDAGAKAIAASPAFAGLTRLDLARCEIGDSGARALIASPHLQNLVRLRLEANSIRNGTDELASPGVMPRLGECWLNGNNVPRESFEKMRAAGRWVSG
jgi:hypothetical protein